MDGEELIVPLSALARGPIAMVTADASRVFATVLLVGLAMHAIS